MGAHVGFPRHGGPAQGAGGPPPPDRRGVLPALCAPAGHPVAGQRDNSCSQSTAAPPNWPNQGQITGHGISLATPDLRGAGPGQIAIMAQSALRSGAKRPPVARSWRSGDTAHRVSLTQCRTGTSMRSLTGSGFSLASIGTVRSATVNPVRRRMLLVFFISVSVSSRMVVAYGCY